MEIASSTGPADGYSARNQVIQLGFNRSPFPEINVIGLVTACDPQRFRFLDRSRYERIAGCRAIWNDQRRYGIFRGAERLNIGIVRVRPGGANHQEVSSTAALAHP